MISEEDISLDQASSNESQKKSDRQWPPSRKGSSLLNIQKDFLKGKIIINPDFSNTPHCIIYFDEDQDALYNRLKRKEDSTIFPISEQYFVLFKDNIPNDCLDTSQINDIKQAFDSYCKKSPYEKELYQKKFAEITTDFKKVVIDLLNRKLRWKKSLLAPKNKHWQRIFATYGNAAQQSQYNDLIPQNVSPSTPNVPASTKEILESLLLLNPLSTEIAALNEPQLNKHSNSVSKISDIDNHEISRSEFPVNFNSFLEARVLTTNSIILPPRINDDKESTNLNSESSVKQTLRKRKCLEKSTDKESSFFDKTTEPTESIDKKPLNNEESETKPWLNMCGRFKLKKPSKQQRFNADLDPKKSEPCFKI